MSEYDDLRPFEDHEVNQVIQQLIQDDDFVRLTSKHLFPKSNIPRRVKEAVISGNVVLDTVYDFQTKVAIFFETVVNETMDSFTINGLESIDLDQRYLFIGNHRDIALDSALLNLALHRHGGRSMRIVAGDNLKSSASVANLMRLNKTFFIDRSVGGLKEFAKMLKRLSQYIYHSIKEDNESVWIAQREGRAKNGLDLTSPALLKMITMCKPKTQPLAEFINDLKVVPVTISYEFDPCDIRKAKEMFLLSKGRYQKNRYEDMVSVGKGVTEYKGRVTLNISGVLETSAETHDELANEIDKKILAGYQLYPSNLLSARSVYGDNEALMEFVNGFVVTEKEEQQFLERLNSVPEYLRDTWLTIYANPVLNRFNVVGE